MKALVLPLLALPVLVACTLSAPGPVPGPEARLEAECALIAEARRRAPALHAGVAEGCPGIGARDTRPLAEQTASLRAAHAAALPAGVVPGSRGEAVFRRLITRGVSPAQAAGLSADPLFAAAAR